MPRRGIISLRKTLKRAGSIRSLMKRSTIFAKDGALTCEASSKSEVLEILRSMTE